MLATRTATSAPRLTWRDALALWLWNRLSGLLHPAYQDTTATPDLRLANRAVYVDVGRRYPIREDHIRHLYHAAD